MCVLLGNKIAKKSFCTVSLCYIYICIYILEIEQRRWFLSSIYDNAGYYFFNIPAIFETYEKNIELDIV